MPRHGYQHLAGFWVRDDSSWVHRDAVAALEEQDRKAAREAHCVDLETTPGAAVSGEIA